MALNGRGFERTGHAALKPGDAVVDQLDGNFRGWSGREDRDRGLGVIQVGGLDLGVHLPAQRPGKVDPAESRLEVGWAERERARVIVGEIDRAADRILAGNGRDPDFRVQMQRPKRAPFHRPRKMHRPGSFSTPDHAVNALEPRHFVQGKAAKLAIHAEIPKLHDLRTAVEAPLKGVERQVFELDALGRRRNGGHHANILDEDAALPECEVPRVEVARDGVAGGAGDGSASGERQRTAVEHGSERDRGRQLFQVRAQRVV